MSIMDGLKKVGRIVGLCFTAPLLWFGISFISSFAVALVCAIFFRMEPTKENVEAAIYGTMIAAVPATILVIVIAWKRGKKKDLLAATLGCLAMIMVVGIG